MKIRPFVKPEKSSLLLNKKKVKEIRLNILLCVRVFPVRHACVCSLY